MRTGYGCVAYVSPGARTLASVAVACSLASFLLGDKPPPLTLPQQGGHSAATESIRLVVEAI